MLSLCPEDFQPIPVTLISLNKNVEPFEIKDFFAINVLKCIDAVDQERSVIEWSSNQIAYIRNLHYKKDPWQDGCIGYSENGRTAYKHYQLDKPCLIAIDALSGAIIWHPKLAKHIHHGPKEFFTIDSEQYRYRT